MQNNTNTAVFVRGAVNPRDKSVHRRAYLDTYAKRRAGLSDAQIQAEVTAATALVAPVHLPAAAAVTSTSPIMAVEQPPVLAPVHQHLQTHAFQVQAPAIAPPNPAPVTHEIPYSPTYQVPQPKQSQQAAGVTHKSYLDTLTMRHVSAVAQAPDHEETVFQPILSEVTQNLLEDTEADKRLEANLRSLYGDQSLTSQITKNTQSASASHIRTIIVSALACGVLAVGMFSFMSSYDSKAVVAQPVGAPVIEVEAPAVQPAAGSPISQSSAGVPAVDPTHPVRLVISSIGVNAPVEGLGTTPDGLIAVPQSYGVVGWYNKGSVPGKPGPAVLVGHYTGGNGGVFDKLNDLNGGDLITTTNGRGVSVTYKVTAKNEYDRDKVPMAELFKKSSDSKLQIITCAGKWQSKNYDKRLVLTAEIVK